MNMETIEKNGGMESRFATENVRKLILQFATPAVVAAVVNAQTGNAFPDDAEYAIKFIKKASGRIGGKKVAIEAKESSIASLRKQPDKTPDEAKRQGLQEQITALELDIQSIYQDDGGEEGLYALMRKAV